MVESRGHVLVVDDEQDIVEFLTTVLQDEGYTTEIAHDGREALAKLQDSTPSLMILDLMMPHVSGFEVLDAMRSFPRSSRPSVIVLSAKSTHQDIVNALERGADDFIPKPFDLEDLLLRIRVWLDRARSAPPRNSTLRIFTLGPFRVFRGDDLVLDEDSGDSRARLLLKYLITELGRPVARSQGLYLLWPDLDETEATTHLDELVHNLNQQLGQIGSQKPYLVDDGTSLTLDPSADLWVDAHEFETQARTAQDAQEAGDIDVALGLFLSALAMYKEDYLRENL